MVVGASAPWRLLYFPISCAQGRNNNGKATGTNTLSPTSHHSAIIVTFFGPPSIFTLSVHISIRAPIDEVESE